MAEALENIVIKVSSDTAQATKGMDRLADAIDRTSKSMLDGTHISQKATNATKQNTDATKKNEKEHKKAGNSAKHHANGLARLAAALKRILIYRAIRGVIKAVTGAINEGIERMYAWSEANDQVFMKVMDTYATEVQYLKDAIGAALAPLIEMVMPYLERLVDWFVELINVVNQFFRALAGYDTWLKVDKVAVKYKEDADKAAKAQKALNNQLMDFDQLNLITTPKSSSKDEEETPPLTGNYVDIDPKIMAFAENFRTMFIEPLESMKTTLGDLWENTLKPLLAEFASGTLTTVGKILETADRVFTSLKQNGVIDAIGNLISKSNVATWELIYTVCDVAEQFISKLAETGALSMIIDAIGAFAVSGIDNLTSALSSLYESGAIKSLAGGISDLFIGLSYVLGAITDIVDLLMGVVNLVLPAIVTSSSGVFSVIGGILSQIGNLISGIVGLLNWIKGNITDVEFWKSALKIVKALFIDPIAGLVKGVFYVFKAIGVLASKDKEKTTQMFDAAEAKLDSAFGVLDRLEDAIDQKLANTEKKTDNTASEVLTNWTEMANAWGDSVETISQQAEEVTTSTAAERLKQWAAEKAEIAKIKDVYGEITEKSLKSLRDTGEITYSEYLAYLKKYTNGTAKEVSEVVTKVGQLVTEKKNRIKTVFSTINNSSSTFATKFKAALATMEKELSAFSARASQYGGQFASAFTDQVKKLAQVKISADLEVTSVNSQQRFTLNPKVTTTATAYAAGGYPDMGSLFVAGEAGAEMVGTINGRTGVASGEEITGIAEAVYGTGATEATLLNAILGAIRSQNLTISPSASLGKVVSQSQRLYQGVTG